jgi:hypothetical protein
VFGVGHSFTNSAGLGILLSANSSERLLIDAVGVPCHKCDPFSPMWRSDSRSFKIKYPDFVADTLQVGANIVSRDVDDSRYVLTDAPTRRKLSDDAKHFRPQEAIV